MSNVTVDDSGQSGTAGAAGASGGTGPAATATNTGTDTSNSATAVGGAGGVGGGGSSAGAGGTGGAGTATATTPASVTDGINATATATGGAGGAAGTPSPGGSGAAGGDGGIAAATATLTTITTGSGSSAATATGGAAGIPSSGGSGTAGGIGGSANAAATTTANSGSATAAADATGGNSAASVGGNGIDGAAATATAAGTGIAATIQASATGGDGGTATGAGNTGGDGASFAGLAFITDAAQATATASSGEASAEASVTGGAGGAGSAGAQGGAGGDASLTNAVVGSSSGTVSLTQNATGGAGGGSTASAGAGGSATSTLNQTPTVNPLTATVSATGGLGGGGATGNAGGAATATIDTTTAGTITTTNGIVVDQSANAYAGDGGISSTAVGGAGGNASASDSATASGGIGAFSVGSLAVAGSGGSGTSAGANGTATAVSTANAVSSAVSALAPGTAYAQSTAWAQPGGASTTLGSGTATSTAETANGLLANGFAEATGGTGTANTTALTSGGLILHLTATSSAPTDGQTYAGATAEENTAASGPSNASDNAYAAAGGLAQFASLGTNVGTVFNNPTTVNFGTGSLGAVYSQYATGAQTYTSSIAWDVNTASLPVGGALDLGLVSPVDASGTLTSLTFQLTEEGSLVVNKTFTSAAAANTYFTDNLVNLGAASAGVGGDLNVTASLSETLSGSGNAYGVDFTLGAAPCYRAGTLIRTERGEVPVEALRVGDRVVSAFGGKAAVTWLGHRHVDCRRHPKPQNVWPVCVAAGAFGEGLPRRDLFLSPDHAVFVDGVLIPIRTLVNGASIAQEPCEHVTYWHVELPVHSVILAEGLPAESYLDLGNRGAFDNGGAVPMDLHPDFAKRLWERDGCAELILGGPVLAAVRQRLLLQAERLGHTLMRDADAHLLVDGEIVRPQMVYGALHRFALTRPTFDELRIVSRAGVPAELSADSADRRRLGMRIAGLAAFRPWQWRQIALADLPDGDGLYGLETADGGNSRWTDGNARLQLPAVFGRDGILLLDMLIDAAQPSWRLRERGEDQPSDHVPVAVELS
jgi:collagen type I/II/III/V/XI/XXIV/XXVII alpha